MAKKVGSVLGGSAPLQRCLSPQEHAGPVKRPAANMVWFKKKTSALPITNLSPLPHGRVRLYVY
jgi:hypothetical protein